MTSPRTAPGWLWPALAAALGLGALVAVALTPPSMTVPPPEKWAMPAAPVASAPLPLPATSATLPPPAAPVLKAIVTVDGAPRLALVEHAGSRLVKVGDVLPDGAAVVAIEPRSLVLRDAGIELKLALDGAVVALSSAPAAAPAPSSASASASASALPPPGYGAIPMPPNPAEDQRAGSGNAAFRAAVEHKARTMRQ